MKRRLFVSHVSVGLLLPLFPPSLLGSPLRARSPEPLAADLVWADTVISPIQNGLIGTIQQVAMSHTYSPERTPLPTLLNQVEHDFERLSRLLGKPLAIDVNQLLVDSPSSAFGSYSARFNIDGLTFVWQGLARHGMQAQPTACQLQILGNKGVLQTTAAGYQILDLTGRSGQPIFSATSSAV